MEAFDILKMVEDEFYNRFFIVDAIVSDDDITMRAVLKHLLIGVWYQFMKISKVKIDEEIPYPLFLAYPSHRTNVVAKHIFSIVNKSRSLGCGWTKADALRIKKNWGYMLKKNKGKKLNS